MHVSIERRVFEECGCDELPVIMMLMHGFTQGRHDWVELDIGCLEQAELYFSAHTTTYAPMAVELARKGSVAAAWTADAGTRIEVSRDDLEHVTEDLSRPAVLVVENLKADGGFVKAICRAFGDQRILDALDKRWLEIASGGGSTTSMVAQNCAANFRVHVRVVTLLDSDSLFPQHRTASHDKADTLEEYGAKTHVLTLREAENYIPNRRLAMLGRPSATRSRLDALKRLSLEQRGYYDMKNGFASDHKQGSLPEARNELYANVPEPVRRANHDGFGGDVIIKAFSPDANLTEEDFDKLGVAAELRNLLATINTVI
jgi:hypothetical protein